MTALNELLQSIPGPDPEAEQAARRQWSSLAKPLGGLGLLEETITRIAALTGQPQVRLDRRSLLVFCADNGVTAQGVSQCGSEVTASVARSLGAGESTVCHMARLARCEVIPVDMGIRDFPCSPGVLNRRIANGTADITGRDAMDREQCVQAILTGAELGRDLRRRGVQLAAAGEMGIGNTTTTAAVTAALLGVPAAAVTGRGAGLSSQGLERKTAAVTTALERSRPDPEDPVDVLTKVGGLDLAGLCGFCLGCASVRLPVLLDGSITAAAALCALRLCPAAAAALLASHVSAEPSGAMLLGALGLSPLISAELRLGEGTGAVAALPLLDMALAVYHSGHTFQTLGIAPYQPQE